MVRVHINNINLVKKKKRKETKKVKLLNWYPRNFPLHPMSTTGSTSRGGPLNVVPGIENVPGASAVQHYSIKKNNSQVNDDGK